jgi:hypothetical protein
MYLAALCRIFQDKGIIDEKEYNDICTLTLLNSCLEGKLREILTEGEYKALHAASDAAGKGQPLPDFPQYSKLMDKIKSVVKYVKPQEKECLHCKN